MKCNFDIVISHLAICVSKCIGLGELAFSTVSVKRIAQGGGGGGGVQTKM